VVVSFLCTMLLSAGSERGAARAEGPTVLGIVAIDGYADLKKQFGWLGGQVGQPGLAAVAETLLLAATQGRGLGGLDVTRPLGAIVTVADGLPVVHGYLPVKSLDTLLESLQGPLGPVEKDGDVRRVTLQNGTPIEFVERAAPSGTWAMATVPGSPDGPADPLPLLEQVVAPFSLGIRVFPSAMPEPLRMQLEMILDQSANAAAAQGQPVDPEAMRGFLANLKDIESIALGLAIDQAGKQVFVESSWAQVAGSALPGGIANTAQGVTTVGAPAMAEGARPAIRGHVAQVVPADMRAQITKSLDSSLEEYSDQPLVKSLGLAARALVAAMLEAGGFDAAVTIDTDRATATAPLPELTLGARIKDGKGLEARLKQLLGAAPLPAAMKVAFDTGASGAATLHTISLDLSDTPVAEQFGESVDLTLAVAPEYAFVLAGGDVKRRAADVLAASGKPDATARPIAGLRAAVDRLLAYAAARGEGAEAKQTAAAAAAAREAGGGTLEVSVTPIDRGIATRLSVDAAALRTVAAISAIQPAGNGGAMPLPPGFPIPAPVR
jgi:hypothetical protein